MTLLSSVTSLTIFTPRDTHACDVIHALTDDEQIVTLQQHAG